MLNFDAQRNSSSTREYIAHLCTMNGFVSWCFPATCLPGGAVLAGVVGLVAVVAVAALQAPPVETLNQVRRHTAMAQSLCRLVAPDCLNNGDYACWLSQHTTVSAFTLCCTRSLAGGNIV